MKAAVLRGIGQSFEIEDVLVSKPGPREVLIRTVAAGVCHTDLHFHNGAYPCPMPSVLGHEAAGVVEQVGSEVRYVQPGDHVITCLSVFCGQCEYCLTGRQSLCRKKDVRRGPDQESRLSLEGEPVHQFFDLSSFAEQMLVHEHAIVKITKDMPLDRAALIGCGVTTGLGAVFNTAGIEPGCVVAVLGCGGIGLNVIQGATIAGASRVIAIDILDSKLELARAFGATDAVDAGAGNPVAQVKELVKGGVDYSFEAIGTKTTAEQAFSMLRAGGTATVIGMIPPGVKIEIDGSVLLGERKIQGSAMGSNRFRVDMPKYVDFYLSGKLKIDEMVSSHIELEDLDRAFELLERGEVTRQVVDIS